MFTSPFEKISLDRLHYKRKNLGTRERKTLLRGLVRTRRLKITKNALEFSSVGDLLHGRRLPRFLQRRSCASHKCFAVHNRVETPLPHESGVCSRSFRGSAAPVYVGRSSSYRLHQRVYCCSCSSTLHWNSQRCARRTSLYTSIRVLSSKQSCKHEALRENAESHQKLRTSGTARMTTDDPRKQGTKEDEATRDTLLEPAELSQHPWDQTPSLEG